MLCYYEAFSWDTELPAEKDFVEKNRILVFFWVYGNSTLTVIYGTNVNPEISEVEFRW